MPDIYAMLSPESQEWVDHRIASGAFVDVGDYFRYLVRRDRADARRDWVRAAIDENLKLAGTEASQAVNEIFAAILQD